MAPRNPQLVQSDAPVLLADLITELQLIGPGVGLLGFSDQIAPVFIIGSRGVTFEAQEPVFLPAEVFNAGVTGVVLNTPIVDTGELPAGDYDVIFGFSADNSVVASQSITLIQRNAGDTAGVASWRTNVGLEAANAIESSSHTPIKFSIRLAEDERFVVNSSQTDAGIFVGIWLMVRRRRDVT